MISGGPLRAVVAYLWRDDGGDIRIPALAWWDGSIDSSDGRKHIVVSKPYDECREPDEEELACGHERVIRLYNGRKYYNRRRRCVECALEGSA